MQEIWVREYLYMLNTESVLYTFANAKMILKKEVTDMKNAVEHRAFFSLLLVLRKVCSETSLI